MNFYCCTIFNSLIDSIKSNYVPVKRYHVYKSEIYPHYVFKLYKKFSKHYKKYKLTHNNFHLLKYKILKKKFSTNLKKRRQLQEVDLVVNKNFKKFFKYFNAKLKCNQNARTFTDINGNILNDPKIISNSFNTNFTSIYELPINKAFPLQHAANDAIIISSKLIKDSI